MTLRDIFSQGLSYYSQTTPIPIGGNAKIAETSGTLLFQPVPVGADVRIACIIFSLFASTPPVVNPDAAAVTQVWAYIGELVFNMLVLVGAVKMSDRIIREMMGL